MSARKLLLAARTARHLRPAQWVYWPLRRLQRSSRPAPPPPEPVDEQALAALAAAVAAWGPGDAAARLARADEVVEGTFRFLGHAEALRPVDWSRRYVSHLWSFNLQYFDYAVDLAWAHRLSGDARYADRFAELAEGWMSASASPDAWEPYAISLRAVNWTYARLLFGAALAPAFAARLDASLHAQLAFLERRLELHLRANHLQKNLQALAVGGLLFRGPAAARWRAAAGRLWAELHEQVLGDGAHFERSPMYHAIALADFLETVALLRAAGQPVPEPAVERVQRMVRAFGVLSRPDGSLHLFNDAAQGIAPSRAWIDARAREVVGEGVPDPQGPLSLPLAGYHGTAQGHAGLRLLVDAGEPGPAYQPGHAHCDLLSFELDLGGRPVVVDSGVSGYEGDPLREYARSTRAHNTVAIGGREQSEVWGTFRLARRARVLHAAARHEGGFRFEGAYRPYHSRAVHSRTVEVEGGGVRVVDRVRGASGEALESYLHLHPDFHASLEEGGTAAVARTAAGEAVRVATFGADSVRIVRGERSPAQGWHCPRFGEAHAAATLVLHVAANDGRAFGYRITPHRTAE